MTADDDGSVAATVEDAPAEVESDAPARPNTSGTSPEKIDDVATLAMPTVTRQLLHVVDVDPPPAADRLSWRPEGSN
ncbi:hypothetical protein GCM10027287_18250 [Bordetella muralis]